MPTELDELKAEVEKIKERNARVEADKAWETSVTRACRQTLVAQAQVESLN